MIQNYQIIRNELAQYNEKLANKIEIIALTKCDSLTDNIIKDKHQELKNTQLRVKSREVITHNISSSINR